jgi:hypothetical protein
MGGIPNPMNQKGRSEATALRTCDAWAPAPSSNYVPQLKRYGHHVGDSVEVASDGCSKKENDAENQVQQPATLWPCMQFSATGKK